MTAPQEEWTEWFQHDGKGCPCVGKMVNVEYANHQFITAIAMGRPEAWDYSVDPRRFIKIIRFRIRKPRALLDLIQLIADLPAPVAPIKTDGVIA